MSARDHGQLSQPAFMIPGKQLTAFWQSQGVPFVQPVSNAQISAFDLHYGTKLPEDFRGYLQTANGMAQTESWVHDDETITFWGLPLSSADFEQNHDFICPAERAWPQCSSTHAKRLFVFADYSLSVFDFAIDLVESSPAYGQVFRLMDAEPFLIAPTFSEFVTAYTHNRHDVIFGPTGSH